MIGEFFNFNTQKITKKAKNDFGKNFYKLLKKSFYRKTKGNARNGMKINYFTEDADIKKFLNNNQN